jgi:hypothetical protein
MATPRPFSFTFPVKDFKRLETPLDEKGFRDYLCVVDTEHLPDLSDWGRSNLRDPKSTGKVPAMIRDSLGTNELFVFMNRGLVLVADTVEFDNKTSQVTVKFSKPEMHGLIDGGHTHLIIGEERDASQAREDEGAIPLQQYVKLEILKGFDQFQVSDIAGARNTSNQVLDESLLNLDKRFDPLKAVLVDQPYFDDIAFKEYECKADGTPRNIDVRDIVSIMYMFNVDRFSEQSQQHPINGYRTKSACLEDFKKTTEKDAPRPSAYDKLYPLVPDLLRLYDAVHAALPDLYDASRKEFDQKTAGGFGRLKGVTNLEKRKKPDILPFTGEPVMKRVPAGFVYPILGAFRALIEERDGQYKWVAGCDPVRLLRGPMGKQMAQALGNTAREDQNPSKTGKNPSLWLSCYQAATIARKDLEFARLKSGSR